MKKPSLRAEYHSNKRLLKSKEKSLVEVSTMLTKVSAKTSSNYLTLLNQIDALLKEIKGIRSAIYRNENDLYAEDFIKAANKKLGEKHE